MPVEAASPALRIGVCGGGSADAHVTRLAEQVGAGIARRGAVLVCGGLGGVMAAAAREAAENAGLTVGVLPGTEWTAANPWIALPLPTGLGEARNALVVRFSDAVIAIGGEWGTLSEVALAKRTGVPVVLLAPTLAADLGVETATDAEDAVARAVAHAEAARDPYGP